MISYYSLPDLVLVAIHEVELEVNTGFNSVETQQRSELVLDYTIADCNQREGETGVAVGPVSVRRGES